MASSDVKVHIATKEDMGAVSALTVAEEWNYPVEYLETLRLLDPEGFFVAKKGDEIVGTGMAIDFDDDFAYFAMSITKKGHRKQGIQRRIFQERFKHAGDRNIGINSANERRKEVNTEIGFTLISHQVSCFRGSVDRDALPSVGMLQSSKYKILPLSSVSFESLVNYDASVVTFHRANFLKLWCKSTGCVTFVSVNESGEILGYINARPLMGDFSVLPLIADNAEIAESLFLTLIHHLPDNEFVKVHPVLTNLAAVELAKKYNIQELLYTITCQFNKNILPVKLDKVFSTSGPEII
ncbi:holothin acyltransferase-like [Ptychodera flava]|uniref:holothin acyltransferase-like n=1 Tax=Ptychodera flava TaxID=63121 RepID=UPI003969E23E